MNKTACKTNQAHIHWLALLTDFPPAPHSQATVEGAQGYGNEANLPMYLHYAL